MNKQKSVIVFVLIPAILVIISVIGLVCVGIQELKYEGIIPPEDHSAKYSSAPGTWDAAIEWNGKTYIYNYDFNTDLVFHSGKAVAQLGENGYPVYEVPGDGGYNFLVLKSFQEIDLYIAQDYVIPEEGEITAVYINGSKRTDAKLLDALERIYSSDDDFFLYKVEGDFHHDHNIAAKKVNLSYEGCPIGSDYKGYLGKVDGKWCYFHDYPGYRVFEKETIPCFEIDEELIPIIDKYF